MNITFRQLRVFTEVAQHGSMARAAAALHLSPPAVSMQIKEVEGPVGLALFDRHGRTLSLSTAGEYFLVHARRLLAALKEAGDAMARLKRLKRLKRGMLTIGMVSTPSTSCRTCWRAFIKTMPGSRFTCACWATAGSGWP
jgi:DNA-binding transcriptional LysR family regulator